jgi:hypothetical protein
VQCKQKRQWPVVKLTTKDIDVEFAEALKFTPSLSDRPSGCVDYALRNRRVLPILKKLDAAAYCASKNEFR